MTKTTQAMMKKTRVYLEKQYQITADKISKCKNKEEYTQLITNFRKIVCDVTSAIDYNYCVLRLINNDDIYDVCGLLAEYTMKDFEEWK